jgi:hypothetical protein
MTRRAALLGWVAALPAAAQTVQPPANLQTAIGMSAIPITEVPAGAMNGVNAVFTLSQAPLTNTQAIYRNGMCLFPACGDYQIAGNVLTFQPGALPQPGDKLVAMYWAQP